MGQDSFTGVAANPILTTVATSYGLDGEGGLEVLTERLSPVINGQG